FVGVVLRDLPAARAANDHLEVRTVRARLDRQETFAGVVRIDWLLRGPEDRRVHTCSERDTQRVVRRHGNDAGIRADELVQVLGIAADDVRRREPAQQRLLEYAN